MTAAIEPIVRDQRFGLRLQTERLSAELLSRRLDLNADQSHRQKLVAAVQQWQQQGYVIEDACVLALFQLSAADISQMHSDSAKAARHDWITDGRHFPELIDTQGARRSAQAFAAMSNPSPGIYPIVDRLDQLEMMLKAGAKILQLRIKSEQLTPEIRARIREAITMSRDAPDCQLFINDFWQTAIDEGAYGVHLGQEDLLIADLDAIQAAGLRLGVSSHAFWEVARAMSIQPSYVACGPLFPTRAKAMPWITQGIDNLRYWVDLIPHPVIGIGGVNRQNLAAIRATGCASASVIQAIVGAEHPIQAFKSLQQQWDQAPVLRAQPSALLARPTLAA
jgi:hydroxymethylpyrimidine kinase/phosphomethylpyrimidine kinase/thiamine-phosphate diphosphorylase